MALAIQADTTGVTFSVRVVPRAKRNGVQGVHDGALKVALTSPPVDGAANEAHARFLSDLLGVPRRSVVLVRGERSRTKTLRIEGTTAEAVRALARDSGP